MDKFLLEDAFLNYVEECLFDSTACFYKYYAEPGKTERIMARRMDEVLHQVKDNISDGFLILGMTYFIELLCKTIDCEDFSTKEQLFEAMFLATKEIYIELCKPITARHKLCKHNLQKNWQSFSGQILHYAEKQLRTDYGSACA